VSLASSVEPDVVVFAGKNWWRFIHLGITVGGPFLVQPVAGVAWAVLRREVERVGGERLEQDGNAVIVELSTLVRAVVGDGECWGRASGKAYKERI